MQKREYKFPNGYLSLGIAMFIMLLLLIVLWRIIGALKLDYFVQILARIVIVTTFLLQIPPLIYSCKRSVTVTNSSICFKAFLIDGKYINREIKFTAIKRAYLHHYLNGVGIGLEVESISKPILISYKINNHKELFDNICKNISAVNSNAKIDSELIDYNNHCLENSL